MPATVSSRDLDAAIGGEPPILSIPPPLRPPPPPPPRCAQAAEVTPEVIRMHASISLESFMATSPPPGPFPCRRLTRSCRLWRRRARRPGPQAPRPYHHRHLRSGSGQMRVWLRMLPQAEVVRT